MRSIIAVTVDQLLDPQTTRIASLQLSHPLDRIYRRSDLHRTVVHLAYEIDERPLSAPHASQERCRMLPVDFASVNTIQEGRRFV